MISGQFLTHNTLIRIAPVIVVATKQAPVGDLLLQPGLLGCVLIRAQAVSAFGGKAGIAT
jgi:hypothetical protein